MPVIDVSVIKAFNVSGVSIKKSFCVYVRLQGQAMRTNTRAGKHDEISFNERFRFQYRPERKGREKNQLFVELWTKSMLSQSCVSVAWVDMDIQPLSQGVPITFNMHGGFEGKQATVTVVIVPVDFGTAPQAPQGGPQPQVNAFYPPPDGQSYFANDMPAVGVPLQVSPYTTAEYVSQQQQPYFKTDPLTGQPMPTSADAANPNSRKGGCEAAPMPPPTAFANASLPPPLFGGGSSNHNGQAQSDSRPPAYDPVIKPPR